MGRGRDGSESRAGGRTSRAHSLIESIQQWNEKNDALLETQKQKPIDKVLPPVEEPDNRAETGLIIEEPARLRSSSMAPLSIYKNHTSQTASIYDKNKAEQLRNAVKVRLENGDDVKQMALEPEFEDVLDVCDQNHFFPAYEGGRKTSFEDWRALRKCEYLRVSEKTLTGLKEVTLRRLSTYED